MSNVFNDPPVPVAKSRKHGHSGRGSRRKRSVFHSPGVKRLTFTDYAQQLLKCVPNEDVTIENPSIYVKKDLFEEHLNRLEDESEFYAYRTEIADYPLEDFLVYYVGGASNVNEFYVCLTVAAKESIEKHLDEVRSRREMALRQRVERVAKEWTCLGSDAEVDGDMNTNNRELYEVELTARYPILMNDAKVQFGPRRVEDARDGYVELLCKVSPSQLVAKRLISYAIQVRPIAVDNVAQTVCTYPKHVWTQYEYDCGIVSKPTDAFVRQMQEYAQTAFADMDDRLYVNSFIDFYHDDYVKLVKNVKYTVTPLFIDIKEHTSFTDTEICKNKTISSISWHHYWSGILIVSYMDVAVNMYTTNETRAVGDEVNRIIYGINPVLVWSFADVLRPRLYLETQREVTTIACCPYDENVIVGGLVNGQIIIWDIKNRLEKVEEEEILTAAQTKYRRILFAMIGWMLNIKNIASVRVTAVSDLLYSHKDAVTHIEWLSPDRAATRTGQIEALEEKAPRPSMQFASSSLDGTILLWDLRSKPATSGEYRGERKLRRLKKKPSALSVDVSPYRTLNRLLRPTFKLDFARVASATVALPLTTFQLTNTRIEYELIEAVHGKRELERSLFRPTFFGTSCAMKLIAGSGTGEYIEGHWDGFEYSSSAVLSQEACKYDKHVQYHDGPIVALMSFPPDPDVTLTVGGKVFAVWHKNMPDRPVLWRKSAHKYTHGIWLFRSYHRISLTRSDGNVEMWDLLNASSSSIGEQAVSGRTLTYSSGQPMTTAQPVFGVGDSNGSYRMYVVPSRLVVGNESTYDALSARMRAEIERKKSFKRWERERSERAAAALTAKRSAERSAVDVKPSVVIAVETKRSEEDVKKKKRDVIPPAEYKQYVYERWLEKEKERMNTVLLSLRHLNPELVREQQAPLKKLELEMETKKKKQRTRAQRSYRIFKENVDMHFPNALREPPPPAHDPYASVHSAETKRQCYDAFEHATTATRDYVKRHPFRYHFQWSAMIRQGVQRRENLDTPYGMSTHRERNKKVSRRSSILPAAVRSFADDEEAERDEGEQREE